MRPDDDESPDAVSGLDVTPRTAAESARGGSTGSRRVLAIAGVVVLLGALGLVLFNGLNDAALFYYNVDEALERRDALGEDRFRMQGNVIEGSIRDDADGVSFTLAFHDAEVQVDHRGDPPELFSADIPVIIEGRFDGDVFRSDEILVRHDNTYTEANEDRLREAREDAERRSAG